MSRGTTLSERTWIPKWACTEQDATMQRRMCYLALELHCDRPILEAVFHVPRALQIDYGKQPRLFNCLYSSIKAFLHIELCESVDWQKIMCDSGSKVRKYQNGAELRVYWMEEFDEITVYGRPESGSPGTFSTSLSLQNGCLLLEMDGNKTPILTQRLAVQLESWLRRVYKQCEAGLPPYQPSDGIDYRRSGKTTGMNTIVAALAREANQNQPGFSSWGKREDWGKLLKERLITGEPLLLLQSICENCTNSPATFRCSRCPNIKYCSAACQRSHWSTHRKACRK